MSHETSLLIVCTCAVYVQNAGKGYEKKGEKRMMKLTDVVFLHNTVHYICALYCSIVFDCSFLVRGGGL